MSYREELEKLPRAKLEEMYAAILELERRQREEKIQFYQPCSPKHLAFHKSEAPIRFVFGPNQCGKSIMGLVDLIFHACCRTHPFTKRANKRPGRYRIFTTDFKKAEEHIIPALKEWVPKKWLRGKSWETAFDQRYKILHGVDGTIIDILSYDQDASVAESVTLDGIWADEEMPEKFYSGSLPRLMIRNGRIWLTVTPLFKMSWAMKYWDKCDDPKIEVFKLSFNDNPHLPEDWKKTFIENCPENERASRIEGTFLEFQGRVYKELNANVHYLRESKQPLSHYPVVMAMDPHQRKGTAITWAYVDDSDAVTFFDEMEIKGTAEEVVAAIKAKEASHAAKTQLRIVDPAANKQVSGYGADLTTLMEFERAGMGFTLAYNASEAGMNVVHQYLRYDKSKPIDALNRPSVYFTQDVPKTWHGMENLLWDDYKFGRDLRDPKETVKDKEKDFPDCVRYTLAIRPTTRLNRYEPVPLSNANVSSAKPKFIDDIVHALRMSNRSNSVQR